jgi:hypothetical protein
VKTFLVNLAIPVFATVQIEADSAGEAERLATQRKFKSNELTLIEGTYEPECVFEDEARELEPS